MSFKKSLSNAGKFLTKHKSRILTGLGLSFGAATVILAVKETPAALMDEEDMKLLADQEGRELTKWDFVKLKMKHYWPAGLVGAAAAGCIIGSDFMDVSDIKKFAKLCATAQEEIKLIKETTKEEVGEKKAHQIEDKVAEKQLKEDPYKPNAEVNLNDMGFLCYDANSGRYFRSTWEILQAAINRVNKKMDEELFASLNDFYSEVGLKGTETGDYNGWSSHIALYPTCHVGGCSVDDPDCVVINFDNDPSLDYTFR